MGGRLVTAVLFVVLATTGAASAAPLTIQDCVRFALAHDSNLAQLHSTVTQAEEAYARQKMQTYPTVVGLLQSYMQKSSNYGGGFVSLGLQQLSNVSQNTASIGTSYTLTSGGLAFIQLAQSKAQMEQAKQSFNRARQQIVTNVVTSYYALAQKTAVVTLDRGDLSYQNVLVSNAQAKERAGVAAGVDVLRAQVAQTKSRSTLLGAQADVQNANDALAQQIGVRFGTQFVVPQHLTRPAPPSRSMAELVAQARKARADIKSARESLLAAQLVRKEYTRELFPTVALTAQIGNQFSPTQAVLEQQQVPPGVIIPRGTPGFWQLGATTSFSLPLVDYGARHAERHQDNAAVTAAQLAFNTTVASAALNVRESYRAAQTAVAQLQYAHQAATLATESAHIAQLQYQHGVISLTDVLQAQQTSLSSQIALVNARVAYVQSIVNLRVAVGATAPLAIVADLR